MITKFIILRACMCMQIASQVYATQSWIDSLPDEQIRDLFHTDRNHVPEFDRVNIGSFSFSRHSRKLLPVKFTIQNKSYYLNLHPAYRNLYSPNIPVWTVQTNLSAINGVNYTYHEIDYRTKDIGGDYFEDSHHFAMVRRWKKGANYRYDGVIIAGGRSFIIRSVKEAFWRKMYSNDTVYNHIVYPLEPTPPQDPSDLVLGDTYVVNDAEKAEVPLTALYPKLLIVIDYHLFAKLEQKVSTTLQYVATYWNAVNLIYQEFKYPKVELTITGIVIAKDEHAMNYVHQARNFSTPGTADIRKILYNAHEYFRTTFNKDSNFTNYHNAMLMTGLNTGRVAGLAGVSTICKSNMKVATVADTGDFARIISAAHELGHTLSLKHDQTDINHVCSGLQGNNTVSVMSTKTSFKSSKHMWTICSYISLRNFATLKAAQCLRQDS